jgi:hypothetical protein
MRKRLLTTLTAFALLAGAGTAFGAGLIPVAIYNFDNPSDITSFQRLTGGSKCVTKLRPQAALGINVGDTSPACVYRSSVIADSDDTSPSFAIQAVGSVEKKTSKKLQRKVYLSLQTRLSATGRYELRIVPAKQKWSVLRDPEGPVGARVLASGTSKQIRPKPGKPTPMFLQTLAAGAGVGIVAQINGRNVFVAQDDEANPPRGRYNGLATGSKTGASALGMLGTFDNITVSIPRNF